MKICFNRCKKSTLTLCPADIPVYEAQALTCEISLYFQKSDTECLCRRHLLLNHDTPFLHHHGNTRIWLFHFPTRHQITLHCPEIDNRMPRNLFFEATGLLQNATTCYVTSSDIHLLLELHGVTGVKLVSLQWILLDTIPIATEHEIQQLRYIAPAEIQKLDEFRSRIAAPRRTYDIDSLLHIHQTTQSQATQTHQFITVSLSLCFMIIVSTLCYLICPHLCIIRLTRPPPKFNTENPATDISPEPNEPQGSVQSQNVLFTTYSLQ